MSASSLSRMPLRSLVSSEVSFRAASFWSRRFQANIESPVRPRFARIAREFRFRPISEAAGMKAFRSWRFVSSKPSIAAFTWASSAFVPTPALSCSNCL